MGDPFEFESHALPGVLGKSRASRETSKYLSYRRRPVSKFL